MTEKEALRILGDTTLCTPLGQASFVAIEAIKKLQQYEEIGTVSECREAVEKQRAKNLIHAKGDLFSSFINHCPICGEIIAGLEISNYCHKCGQRLE